MILEVTKRCNMHCPVCFASAGECLENGDLSIDEIEKQYDFLMDHGGPFNIQLSGGEPSHAGDLPGDPVLLSGHMDTLSRPKARKDHRRRRCDPFRRKSSSWS